MNRQHGTFTGRRFFEFSNSHVVVAVEAPGGGRFVHSCYDLPQPWYRYDVCEVTVGTRTYRLDSGPFDVGNRQIRIDGVTHEIPSFEHHIRIASTGAIDAVPGMDPSQIPTLIETR